MQTTFSSNEPGVNIASLQPISSAVAWWPRVYQAYKQKTPNHRGKHKILNTLLQFGLKQQIPFLWHMKNKVVLSISPRESSVPNGVGWTCFEQGIWEPHVEKALRRSIRTGDTVLDIGANIGYFSGVIAQCVGANGQVFAFEPVPTTFQQLIKGMAVSGFKNLTAFPIALGANSGRLAMNHDPDFPGGDSLYQWNSNWKADNKISIEVRRLDDLIAQGVVTAPDLIKIDIEGHELDALAGAQQILKAKKPLLIMEFNKNLSSLAHWTLSDMATFLRSCGYQYFYLLDEKSQQIEIDPDKLEIAPDAYVDLLISANEIKS